MAATIATLPQEPQPELVALPEHMNTDVDDQLQAISIGLHHLIQAASDCSISLDDIQLTLSLQPMRLTNATSNPDAPLSYPDGYAAGGPLPVTKREAFALTGAQCAEASEALGLKDIPSDERSRVTQFLTYMGLFGV